MRQYDPSINYYELLQVHPRASTPVIKAAYRVIQRELRAHPDLGGREDFAAVLNEAYRVLTDPELRMAYDGERLLAGGGEEGAGSRLEQVVACPHCGASNSVRLGADLSLERCAACGRSLKAPTRERAPETKDNAFDLPPDQYRGLCQNSQVDVRRQQVEPGDRLRCRFCGNEWEAQKPGRPLRTCPVCGREDWHAYRILKCRVCGHEWQSARLSAWAYKDHPRCPKCANARWSSYCESHPLRWFLGLLHR